MRDRIFKQATQKGIYGTPFNRFPDLGKGTYYISKIDLFGNTLGEVLLKFSNPLVLCENEAYQLANKYETIVQDISRAPRDPDEFKKWIEDNPFTTEVKLENSERLSRDMLNMHHDGLIVFFKNILEITDYRGEK